MKILLPILLLISSVFSLNAQSKKYQGLLWEISGNGLSKPSYLYGTMHVSKKVAFHLTDTFFVAIKNADVVALETNPGKWMDNMIETNYFLDAINLANKYKYGTNLYNSFNVGNLDREKIAQTMAKDNNLINGLLFRYGSNSADFEEQTYLDLFIYQSGKRLKKQIAALEDYERSNKRVRKAAEPDKNQKLKYPNLYKYYKDGKSIFEQIEDAYRMGDLDLLDSLTSLSNPSKNYRKYMLTLRNVEMANNMDSIMKKQTVFAGIGAAHLPNDDGVIELLRKKGYKVRPVVKKISKKADKLKAKWEKITVNLPLVQSISSDSTFAISLPGKLVEFPTFDGQRTYFYPDMINGAFYTITRYNTNTIFNGLSTTDYLKRIDSLLYENIPGDIIQKKEVTVNGFKGIDILNKTRRGDYQRYLFAVTPINLFIVKMGGVGEYVKNNSNDIFNSITINLPSKKGEVKPKHGEFSINMPGNVLLKRKPENFKSLTQNIEIIGYNNNQHYYLKRINYSDYKYIEEDTFELNYFTELIADEYNFLIKNKSLNTFNNYPCIDFTLKHKTKDFLFYGKIIIKGNKYYLLAHSNTIEKKDDSFFNSFKFENYKFDTLTTYVDSSLLFTAKSYVATPHKSSFSNMLSLYASVDKEGTDHLEETKNLSVKEPNTGESILVNYYKFDRFYYYKSKKKYWKEQIKLFNDGKSLQLKSQTIDSTNNKYTVNLTFTDTNSIARIDIQSFLHHGVLYTLYYYTDTITGKSDFAKTFFSSFTPFKDTIVNQSIFTNKSKLFFNHLHGVDSLKKHQAITSVANVEFTENYTDSLINAIGKLDFDFIKDKNYKPAFIRTLGFIQDNKVIDYYIDLYKNLSDSASLQLAVLEGLAYHQTKIANNTFLNCLKTEIPLTNESDDIYYIFSAIADSIELTQRLFPELLSYIKYPEYKWEIYQLLAQNVDSNYIDRTMLEEYFNDIVYDAKLEVKRQLADDEGKNAKDYKYNTLNYKITDLITILSLFKEDVQVQKIFNNVMKSRDHNLRIEVSKLLYEKKATFKDTLWTSLFSNIHYAAKACSTLEKLDLEDKIDTNLSNQEFIAKSLIFANELLLTEDSIQFIEKKQVSIKGNKKGWVYFFKSKEKDDDEWLLSYCGIQPLQENKVTYKADFTKKFIPVKISKGEAKTIDECMKSIRAFNRKRASNN